MIRARCATLSLRASGARSTRNGRVGHCGAEQEDRLSELRRAQNGGRGCAAEASDEVDEHADGDAELAASRHARVDHYAWLAHRPTTCGFDGEAREGDEHRMLGCAGPRDDGSMPEQREEIETTGTQTRHPKLDGAPADPVRPGDLGQRRAAQDR